VPQLVGQGSEELSFMWIVAVRRLKAPLVDDNTAASAVTLSEGVDRLLLVDILQVEHISCAFARRQTHFA